MEIVVDTRERKPLWTKDVIVKKLDVGDYSLKGYENTLSVEFKRPGDAFGTFGKGHKRFKKELEKAKDYSYFAIVVAAPYSTLLAKSFTGAHYSHMKGYILTKIIMMVHMKYNVPVFFCKNEQEAKCIIKEIFRAYLKVHGEK